MLGHSPDEATIPPPCVVKPPDRQGQRGLSVVLDRQELADAAERANAESRTGGWLVEELIDGPEITVNGFSVDGRFHALTITDRLVAEPPAFGVALAHAWPSEQDPGTIAADAARALGIDNGPTYTQIRFGAGGPKVIEVAARLGGGHDAELCHAAIGVDLNGAAIAAALGEPVDENALIPRPRVAGACTRFLVAPRGVLDAVDGLAEAQAAPGVLDVRMYRQPGHRFGLLRTGPDRAGAIIATGATRDGALANADAAAERITFRVT